MKTYGKNQVNAIKFIQGKKDISGDYHYHTFAAKFCSKRTIKSLEKLGLVEINYGLQMFKGTYSLGLISA